MTGDKAPDGISAMVGIRLLSFFSPRGISEGVNLNMDGLDALLREAEHDLVAFETLRRLTIILLREECALPSILRTWVSAVLDGSMRPPKKPGQHPAKNWIRDLGICCEIHRLIRDKGMTGTRNRYPNVQSTPQSACDVVAERHGMSYTAVAKIWQRYAHLR